MATEKRRPAGAKNRLRQRHAALLLFAGSLTVLAVLVVLAGLLVLRMGRQAGPLPKAPGKSLQGESRFPSDGIPPYEVFPEKEALQPEPGPLPDLPIPDRTPKVAIVIDDLGYDLRRARAFIGLGAPLTFSILPQSPRQKEVAEAVRTAGNEIMLHLPMEPDEYPKVDPGPGALLMDMPPDVFIRQIVADLETLPHARGVNNHMGSRITADRDRMTILFSVLKERGLFFLDSRTTAKSVAASVARAAHLDFAQRDVFLDHIPKAPFIEKQVDRLVRQAVRKGAAIGIAHPYGTTYRVLKARLPGLMEAVALVPASVIVYRHRAGEAVPEAPSPAFRPTLPSLE